MYSERQRALQHGLGLGWFAGLYLGVQLGSCMPLSECVKRGVQGFCCHRYNTRVSGVGRGTRMQAEGLGKSNCCVRLCEWVLFICLCAGSGRGLTRCVAPGKSLISI